MEKNTSYTKYFWWGIIAIVFFGLIKCAVEFEGIENLNTGAMQFLMIMGIVLMTFLVLAVHELGHLVTGLICGFRFELFIVGPLGVKRENGRINIYLNQNLAYYGGLAATSPIDDDKENAQKFAKVLLAGPIASVLFAIVCFVVAYLVSMPLGIIFYGGAATSIAVFFATTIPSKTGVFFSDRKRYQRLVTPGKDQEVELAILSIMGKFSKDDSYKNIESKDIEILIADDVPFVKYYGLFNLICWQLQHKGAVDEATKEAYETASKKISKSMVGAFDKEIEKYSEKYSLQ